MSVTALSWAFKAPMADATAKAVLVALADHADANATCWPGVARISVYTALGERTIERAVARLEGMGAIAVVRSDGRANRYRLMLDWAGQPPSERRPRQSDAAPPSERRGYPRQSDANPRQSDARTINNRQSNRQGTVKGNPPVAASRRHPPCGGHASRATPTDESKTR